MEKEKFCITVFRDTIEKWDENWDWNLANVIVEREFVEQYLEDCHKDKYKNLEEFMEKHITGDVDDFYKYAMKHNAVIAVENW